MLTSDLIASAVQSLTINPRRTALTLLGIVIGVGAVVLMVSVGRTFSDSIAAQVSTIGSSTIDVFPTGLEKFGSNLDAVTFEDALAIERLATVENVTPVIIVKGEVRFGRENKAPMVLGAKDAIFRNYGLTVERGRLLDARDEEGATRSAVLASQTALDLFGSKDPLGETVKIADHSFTVVGILKSAGSLLLSDMDTPVYIPFSTAKAITGQKYVSYVSFKAADSIDIAATDVRELLRERHRIRNPEGDPDKDDFIVRSSEQVTGIIQTVLLGLTAFLSVIASISLIVGGIGIMNTMLVVIAERRAEIGLRKALGASERDILRQFLFEAVALTSSGAMIGVVFGVSGAWVLARIADRFLGSINFSLAWWSIVLGVAMGLFSGLIFGIYPAIRASRLHPIEALREE